MRGIPYMLEGTTWQRMWSTSRTGSCSWQTAREKAGASTCSCKELNSASSLNELRSGFFPNGASRWEHSPASAWIPRRGVPGPLMYRRWASKQKFVDHNKLSKFLKRWEYQTTLPVSWEICMQVKKQRLELDMEQQTGSKLGKEYDKAVYCDPAYLTSMQSTSWEMPGWMNHKLESRLPGEMSTASDMQMIPHLKVRNWRGSKEPLDESERGEWKSWLKTQHSKH